jgi:hypothetical protein
MFMFHPGIANFIVSIAFIPLRDFLAHIGGGEENQGQGRVFFVFAFVLAACGFGLARLYKP